MAEQLKRSQKGNSFSEDDKMSILYQNGLDLMAKNTIRDFEFASLIFENLNGYGDSVAKLNECRSSILSIKRDNAKILMDKGDIASLEEAQKLLSACDPNDALVKECAESIASLKYEEANDLMSAEEYEQALAIFESIPGYEDVEDKVKECEEFIEQIKAEEERRNRPKWPKVLLTIVLLAILACGGYFGYKFLMSPVLKVKPVTIELGEEVVLDPELFVQSKKNISKLSLDSELLTSDDFDYNEDHKTVVSKDKNHLAVGTYTIKISGGGLKGTTTLEVVDTKAPTIKGESVITHSIYSEIPDLESLYTVEDLSNFTKSIDASAVNWNEPGEYEVKIDAEDEYGNKKSMAVKVVVEGYAEPEQSYDYSYDYYYYEYTPEAPAENVEETPGIIDAGDTTPETGGEDTEPGEIIVPDFPQLPEQ